MKALIIMMMIFSLLKVVEAKTSSYSRPVYKQTIIRKPASISVKQLITIDERKGCCSRHGGILGCAAKYIECKDGFVSMCGCQD